MFNILRSDFKHGCLEQWKKYFVVAVLTLFLCFQFYIMYTDKIGIGKFSYSDYMFWMFRGMEYNQYSANVFLIPNGFWLALNLYLSVFIGMYPIEDLRAIGKQKIMQIGKRQTWWIGKCIWCVCCVLLYYAVILGVIGIFTLLAGQGLELHEEVGIKIMSGWSGEYHTQTIYVYMLVMIAFSVVVSLIQNAISVILNVICGELFVAMLLIFAVYASNGFSPANYTMLIRLYEMRIDVWLTLFVLAGIALITIILSSILIKRKEL